MVGIGSFTGDEEDSDIEEDKSFEGDKPSWYAELDIPDFRFDWEYESEDVLKTRVETTLHAPFVEKEYNLLFRTGDMLSFTNHEYEDWSSPVVDKDDYLFRTFSGVVPRFDEFHGSNELEICVSERYEEGSTLVNGSHVMTIEPTATRKKVVAADVVVQIRLEKPGAIRWKVDEIQETDITHEYAVSDVHESIDHLLG